jgi:hypothetical protein
MQTKYRGGVGKLMYLMRYSRPDIYNAVRDLARHMVAPNQGHYDAMMRTMAYVVGTPERGLTLAPDKQWDGSKDFEFEITGESDSDYAKCLDTRKSISGIAVFLNKAPVVFRSATQKTVCLSVTEAEQAAGVACAQDMLYVMRLVQGLGLKVKLPMELRIDNKGAVDLANNWSCGGRTRHVDVRQYFLRDLKEEGLIVTKWKSGLENAADGFTKNLGGPAHNKHVEVFCGRDAYYPRASED